MSIFINFLKGFFVGASMLIPGFSGGTMAMILGVYDKIIFSLNSILNISYFKNKTYFKKNKEHLITLGIFCLGSLIGIVIFSKPVLFLIETYGIITIYFFMGAAFGGIFPIYKKIRTKSFDFIGIIFIVLGALIVYSLSIINSFMPNFDLTENIIFIIFGGIIAAVALILPGISVSYMLLLLGLYDKTISSINSLYIPYIVPLAAGIVIGIALTTKILSYAMTKHTRITYLIIFGFIIGSVAEVFPGIPKGINIFLCPLAFFAALFLIKFLQKFDIE